MHWIIVADASRARVFSAGETLERFVLEHEIDHPQGRAHTHELVSDSQGRSRGSGGPPSAQPPHTAPHEVELQRFARSLAAKLRRGRLEGRYERLILAAPPRFLGALRGALDPPTLGRVVESLAHDWTKLASHELPAIIRRALPDTAGMPDAG
ncbi:MAG TPA: host attachment protein [Deltaproteobacteria bacterium]|nr:host attachment protein [Deltaproteobacteria bacterium]